MTTPKVDLNDLDIQDIDVTETDASDLDTLQEGHGMTELSASCGSGCGDGSCGGEEIV